jgi:hypothetical protein
MEFYGVGQGCSSGGRDTYINSTVLSLWRWVNTVHIDVASISIARSDDGKSWHVKPDSARSTCWPCRLFIIWMLTEVFVKRKL